MPARPKVIRVRLVGNEVRPDIDSHQRLSNMGFTLESSPSTGLVDGVPTPLSGQKWENGQEVYTWTYRKPVKKFVLYDAEIEKSGSDMAATQCLGSGALTSISIYEDAVREQAKTLEALRDGIESNCMKIIYIEVTDDVVAGSSNAEAPVSEVIFDPFNTEKANRANANASGGRRRRRPKTKRRHVKRSTRRRRS